MSKKLLKMLIICNNTDCNIEIAVQQFTRKSITTEKNIEIIDFNFYPFDAANNYSIQSEVICKKVPSVNKIKCKYCGKCVEFCKIGGISFNRQIPLVAFDKTNCISCFACLKACNISAIKQKDYQIGITIKQNIDENLFIRTFHYKTFSLYAKHISVDFQKNENDHYQVGIINSENYSQLKNIYTEQIMQISETDNNESVIAKLKSIL